MNAKASGSRWAGPTALGLTVVAVALFVVQVALGATRPADLPQGLRVDVAEDAIFSAAYLVFVAVGAIIVRNHPRNVVGWAFVGGGLSHLLYAAALELSVYGYFRSDAPYPGADLVVWLWHIVSPLGLVFFPLMLLHFPTGRPPTPRWRLITRVTGVAGVTMVVCSLAGLPHRGPHLLLGQEPDLGVWDSLWLSAMFALTAAMLLGAVSLIVRYRRAAGVERQQLKWVAFGAFLVIVVIVLDATGILGTDDPLIVTALAALAFAAVPISAAIAILRHRLFDIDRLVKRTLVYAVVTASLGAGYVATVVLLQFLMRPFAGSSDLAVAGSTLAVAAAFGPVRWRVQRFVDRRFDRARYDASLIVQSFGQRLRSEVDLDQLQDELRDTVCRSVQPRGVSLWSPVAGAEQ